MINLVHRHQYGDDLDESNGGIFMASFELIGIPSYDGIFRNIILNLLLSDNHHCFTSPSSSSRLSSSSSPTDPKSKSDWCLSMIQNRQNNQGAAAGQRARMCPGIILWPTDCARSASNAEPDSTVIVQQWRSVHHWPFLERIEDLEQQCSAVHRYWHLPPIWHPGC